MIEDMNPIIIGERASKDGRGTHWRFLTSDLGLNLYQKIEKCYGIERVVPTIMLLLAAKCEGIIEGDLFPGVTLAYNGNGDIIHRNVSPEDCFSADVEKYALLADNLNLRWKKSKKMLAIFANMCIGGGWGIKLGKEGYEVSYDGNMGFHFRDIWSDTFNVDDLGNSYNQCFGGGLKLKIKDIQKLYAIQNRAEDYCGLHQMILKRRKGVVVLLKDS